MSDREHVEAPTAPADPSAPEHGRFAAVVRTARGRRRGVVAGAVVVVSIVVAAVVVLSVRGGGEPDRRSSVARLETTGDATIAAGEPWIIELSDSVDDAIVVLSGAWGSERFAVTGPTTRVEVPPESTTRAGNLLAVIRDGRSTATAVVDIEPGPPVDGATPLAGPRSMIADRQHWVMVTALPRDRYGNVVEDGTVVEVLARHPDGGLEVLTAEVQNLYAAVRVFSETLAGRTGLRLETGGATGPEVEVLEVPGPPAEVVIEPVDAPLRADGRQLVTIRTAMLTDRFGNEVLDGTAAVATVIAPTGRSTQRGLTVDARVEVVIEAPAAPGEVVIELDVDGVRSVPMTLDFVADVAELPVVATYDDGVLRVQIGSVLTGLGGFVPDGTTAVVEVEGRIHEVVLEDGFGAIEIETERVDTVTVEVLGVSRTAVVS